MHFVTSSVYRLRVKHFTQTTRLTTIDLIFKKKWIGWSFGQLRDKINNGTIAEF